MPSMLEKTVVTWNRHIQFHKIPRLSPPSRFSTLSAAGVVVSRKGQWKKKCITLWVIMLFTNKDNATQLPGAIPQDQGGLNS